MTDHPTEITVKVTCPTQDTNTYVLIDKKYMRHVDNDIYYILILRKYHNDHMEYEIHYDANKILEFLNILKNLKTYDQIRKATDNNEFIEIRINKKFFDNDIEKITFGFENGQNSGYAYDNGIQVTFDLKLYMTTYHNKIYNNICDVLNNVDTEYYGNILWK